MFDNSLNHHAREPGTASTDQLNLNDRGKIVVNFKDTTFRGSAFAMQHVVNGKLFQKGAKWALWLGWWPHSALFNFEALQSATSMLKREPQRSTVVAVGDVSLCTKFPEYKMLVRGSNGWLRRLWIDIPPQISLRAQLYRKNLGIPQGYSEMLLYLQVRRSPTDVNRNTCQCPTALLKASCKILFQIDVRLSWRPDGTVSWLHNEEIHESSLHSEICRSTRPASGIRGIVCIDATEILSIWSKS